MFFVYNPQEPRYTYDPEEIYQEYRRREYIAALQEQQQRALFERELALEEERHRRALALLAQQEVARRQHQASRRFAPRRPHQHVSGACTCGQDPDACVAPDYQEIFRRRQARQQEEEDRSRDFHRDILARIFGVPVDAEGDTMTTDEPATQDASPVSIEQIAASNEKLPAKASPANEPSGNAPAVKDTPAKPTPAAPTTVKPAAVNDSMPENQQSDELEPHWSNASNRTQSLAEITAINRTFTSLKHTFVFPSGTLEGIPGSNIPRLAYNATNAAIHAYQHALADLLIQLDGIESFGFQGVREARKQLVVKIEQAMEELERMITERLGGSAAPITDETTMQNAKEQKSNQDVEIGDANEQTTSTDAAAASIIPEASVTTDASLHKDAEEVTIRSTADSSTHDATKGDTATGDEAQLEKPATATATDPAPSVPEEQEVDKSVPAPADANPPPAAPIDSSPAKAKLPTFSVTDEEDWEIEDAVKTVA